MFSMGLFYPTHELAFLSHHLFFTEIPKRQKISTTEVTFIKQRKFFLIHFTPTYMNMQQKIQYMEKSNK